MQNGRRGARAPLLALVFSAQPLLWSSSALSDEGRPAPHFGGQRSVGFGPAAGLYSGFGAMLGLEAEPVGLALSGGYMPLLIFGNEGYDRRPTFDYFGSGQLNADLVVGPLYHDRRVDLHLLSGYRYNSVLGSGVGVGIRIAMDVSRAVRLEFHWTPHVFPAALDRLRERGYPDGRDPALPWIHGGVGAALMFYP